MRAGRGEVFNLQKIINILIGTGLGVCGVWFWTAGYNEGELAVVDRDAAIICRDQSVMNRILELLSSHRVSEREEGLNLARRNCTTAPRGTQFYMDVRPRQLITGLVLGERAARIRREDERRYYFTGLSWISLY